MKGTRIIVIVMHTLIIMSVHLISLTENLDPYQWHGLYSPTHHEPKSLSFLMTFNRVYIVRCCNDFRF